MLRITTSDGFKIDWFIGQQKPEIYQRNDIRPITNLEFPFRKVHSVYADGDELVFIKTNFSNLPMRSNAAAVMWHGDLAQFIVYNL